MNIIKPFLRTSTLFTPPSPIAYKNLAFPVSFQFNASRAYASMTAPTIKLNSGHQMPIVGFG